MAGEHLILQFAGSKNESPVKITRTPRSRTKPKKYTDFLQISPTKRAKIVTENETSEEDDTHDEMPHQKSSALFDEDDVEGQDIFKFKSRHTKNDLQDKVKNAVNNSPVINTPKRKIMANKSVEGTPKLVKEIIKKRIVKEVESDSDVSDFSASTSDFVPDEDNESESSSVTSASDSENVQNNKTVQVHKKNNKIKAKDTEYFVLPDNYFMMNASKKITTSDHTLARLKNLNINEQNDENCTYISEEHQSCISRLNQHNEQMFDKWLHVLSENFNVIVYGVGSKKGLLQEFQRQKLKDFPCVVVNGYFPSLTIKSILESIIVDLLENNHVPSNTGDVVSLIDDQLTECDTEMFLIIHNIDGPMLRNSKTQSILANISQIRNVHTIASIDHINAPLLWDHSKLSKLRWSWWDGTSLAPYASERGAGGARAGGALPLGSLRTVHAALTANAKLIFNILIRHQLDHHKQSHYQGLPFKDLYSKSREQFLVSSELALRAQLTEFLDHKLVKIKKSYDASENLVIPIENSLLQQFLEENS